MERQEAELKAKTEELELNTALATSDAKLKVLEDFESGHRSIIESTQGTRDVKERHAGHSHGETGPVHPHNPQLSKYGRTVQQHRNADISSNVVETLCSVMQQQANISELMMEHHKGSTLPPMDIPTFKGDLLDYHLFIRAIEHGVEDRTENNKDRLYYLEQFTSGQPRELTRSCLHMEPAQGYNTAKQLLREQFGNEHELT